MKILIAAAAMAIASPALAQAVPPAHADHAEHAEHAEHANHAAAQSHTGHPAASPSDPHAGHDMPAGKMDCCKKAADGTMACCAKMAAGKPMPCCDKAKEGGKSESRDADAGPHAGHNMPSQ